MKDQFISHASRDLLCNTIQCSIFDVVTEFNNMSFLASVTRIMHAFCDVTSTLKLQIILSYILLRKHLRTSIFIIMFWTLVSDMLHVSRYQILDVCVSILFLLFWFNCRAPAIYIITTFKRSSLSCSRPVHYPRYWKFSSPICKSL